MAEQADFDKFYFTFQSGHIPILQTIDEEFRTEFLYIPIWSYSNLESKDKLTAPGIFTFQSGHIPMRNPLNLHTLTYAFTFQSGHIPMSDFVCV